MEKFILLTDIVNKYSDQLGDTFKYPNLLF